MWSKGNLPFWAKPSDAFQRLQTALEVSETGTFRWDIAANRLEWDDQLYRLYGLVADGSIRRVEDFLTKVHPEDRAIVERKIKDAQSTGSGFSGEMRIVRPDGSTRWLYDRAKVLPNDRGETSIIIGACVDITDRKLWQQEAMEREARLQDAQAVAHIGSWELELTILQNSEVTRLHWSDEIFRILGYAPKSIPVSRAFYFQCIHPQDRSRVEKAISHTIATSGTYEHEYRIVRPQGEERIVQSRGKVFCDEGGRPLRLVGTLQDITERRKAEESLLASEERFRQVAESLPQLVWTATPDGFRDYASQQWISYTGLPMAEVLYDGWLNAIHPDDRTRVADLWKQAVAGQCAYDTEYRLLGKEGAYRWFKARAIALRDAEGRISKWFGTSTDINDLKQAETQLADLSAHLEDQVTKRVAELRVKEAELEQARRLESLGRLAGGVAHDFNNLITGILGLTQALRDEISDSRIQRDLEDVLGAAQRAGDLTRQLLAFGRRQPAQPTTVDVNAAFKGMIRLFMHTLRENIRLRSSLDSQVGSVRVDVSQLEQVILNLVLNAQDAMPNGGEIVISTTVEEVRNTEMEDLAPGSYAVITVSDQGEGIRPEVLPHIFEPFFTTKTPGKGTGMGLATAYGIIKQHAGTIRVKSMPGEGSSFRVFLPRTQERQKAVEGGTCAHGAVRGSEHILVVEDEEIVRRVIRRTLAAQGYRVQEAGNAEEALKLLGGQPLDLLVTDIVMPGMNGRDLADTLARGRPTLKVLYMSGHSVEQGFKEELLRVGREFIEKPVTSDVLAHKVREVLDRVTGFS